MIVALQLVLMVLMVVLSLLVFFMVRQMGAISRRIHERSDPATPSLEVGIFAPMVEFSAYNKLGKVKIPVAGSGETHLLFLAFSCPLCRPLLESLHRLPKEFVSRTLILLLDKDSSVMDTNEYDYLQRAGFVVAEGFELATPFKISATPFVYIVDERGVIRNGASVHSIGEMISVIADTRKARTQIEEKHYAKAD